MVIVNGSSVIMRILDYRTDCFTWQLISDLLVQSNTLTNSSRIENVVANHAYVTPRRLFGDGGEAGRDRGRQEDYLRP